MLSLRLCSFADSHNPCCAYLWESAAFQALLDSCCSCCAGLLQPTAEAVAAAASTSPPPSESSSTGTTSGSLVLRQLSSQSCSALFAAFAAAAAPSEQLWGLARRHVAQQQQQQQQQQQPFLRSGTMLGNEVATARTAALLEKCSVGLGVLQATAAAAAEGKQPLPIPAVRHYLLYIGGYYIHLHIYVYIYLSLAVFIHAIYVYLHIPYKTCPGPPRGALSVMHGERQRERETHIGTTTMKQRRAKGSKRAVVVVSFLFLVLQIRWVLSMLGGLASGAEREGARRLLQWLGPTLRCAFAVTRAVADNPQALKEYALRQICVPLPLLFLSVVSVVLSLSI